MSKRKNKGRSKNSKNQRTSRDKPVQARSWVARWWMGWREPLKIADLSTIAILLLILCTNPWSQTEAEGEQVKVGTERSSTQMESQKTIENHENNKKVGYNLLGNVKPDDDLSKMQKALRIWPLITAPSLPQTNKSKPEINIPPPLMAWNNEQELYNALIIRLSGLLKNHPSAEVHEYFYENGKRQQLALSISKKGKNAIAGFSPGINSVSEAEKKPNLWVDRDYLLLLDTKKKVEKIYLALFHESVHYEQWQMNGRQKEIPDTGYLPHPAVVQKLGMTTCVTEWLSEREAYFRGCELALQWGNEDIQSFCANVGSLDAFDQIFFAAFSILDEEEECLPIWAELAGHPHPEVYL